MAAPLSVRKRLIVEKLFTDISRFLPEFALAKYPPKLPGLTSMLLDMKDSEFLLLLEPEQQLKINVEEALRVLEF